MVPKYFNSSLNRFSIGLMSEYLSTAEVNHLIAGLQSGVRSLFGDRLDYPSLIEHSLSVTTAVDRYSFYYLAVDVGAASLMGSLEVIEWKPADMAYLRRLEDMELNNRTGLHIPNSLVNGFKDDADPPDYSYVDRTTLNFNFADRGFHRLQEIVVAEPSDTLLYEETDAQAFTYIPPDEVDYGVKNISDAAAMNVDNITYEDRDMLSRVFGAVGVLLL